MLSEYDIAAMCTYAAQSCITTIVNVNSGMSYTELTYIVVIDILWSNNIGRLIFVFTASVMLVV